MLSGSYDGFSMLRVTMMMQLEADDYAVCQQPARWASPVRQMRVISSPPVCHEAVS